MSDITAYVSEDVGFYPTPPELVDEMISGINWDFTKSVLEPSAGKGNIVLRILERLYDSRYSGYSSSDFRNVNIDCCEIDANLRAIINYKFSGPESEQYIEKSRYFRNNETADNRDYYRKQEVEYDRLASIHNSGAVHIVSDDFLNYRTFKRYDLIIMNPPFEHGAEHLLKAIAMQEEYGGKIVCLLNAETIKNPYSNIRKILQQKLSEHNAEITYLQNQFVSAERKTGVEIAMVKINIPIKQRESAFFENLIKAKEIKQEDIEHTDVVTSDPIHQMIDLFNFEVEGTLKLINEYEAMKPYMLDALPYGETEEEKKESIQYSRAILTLNMAYGERSYNQSVDINEYLQKVRMKYWRALLRNDQFTGQLTSNLRKEFNDKVAEMADYDFTEFNIQQVLKKISESLCGGIEETILTTFDKLSAEHSYYDECAKNIHYYNGWKSNKAHMINRKVIIPIYGCFNYDSWYKKYDDTIAVETIYATLSDIEKSLNYLDNCETAEVDLYDVLVAARNRCVSKKIPCKYFNVTFYKKGTCHIEFTNQRLLDKLNIFGSQRKGWLPPCYGKKHYKDMSREEAEVIDQFQGESAYEKVLSESQYYLTNGAEGMMPLLGGGA